MVQNNDAKSRKTDIGMQRCIDLRQGQSQGGDIALPNPPKIKENSLGFIFLILFFLALPKIIILQLAPPNVRSYERINVGGQMFDLQFKAI